MNVSPGRFFADRRAGVAAATALLSTVILGFAALAVDVGNFYFQKAQPPDLRRPRRHADTWGMGLNCNHAVLVN